MGSLAHRSVLLSPLDAVLGLFTREFGSAATPGALDEVASADTEKRDEEEGELVRAMDDPLRCRLPAEFADEVHDSQDRLGGAGAEQQEHGPIVCSALQGGSAQIPSQRADREPVLDRRRTLTASRWHAEWMKPVRASDVRWETVSLTVGLAAVLAPAAIAFLSRDVLTTDGSVAIIVTSAVGLVVALIALDIPVAIDPVPGNTFSELLREGAAQATVIPWAFGVFAGRWFHPIDGLNLFGAAGPVALMALSWLVVAGVALIRHRSSAEVPVPVWTVVAAGLIAGSLLWPAG
jgi:hypothetical protein